MPERNSRLTLTTGSSSLHVSALSSLLRTLQAAVRDAAHGAEAGARLLAAQPPPVLEVSVTGVAGEGLTLSFGFLGPDGAPQAELDAVAFPAFMSGLAAALRVSPQRTLWGTPVRPITHTTAENERMRLFLEDLVRLRDVTVSAGERTITISEGRVEATGA
jgi:hypothetical protein